MLGTKPGPPQEQMLLTAELVLQPIRFIFYVSVWICVCVTVSAPSIQKKASDLLELEQEHVLLWLSYLSSPLFRFCVCVWGGVVVLVTKPSYSTRTVCVLNC